MKNFFFVCFCILNLLQFANSASVIYLDSTSNGSAILVIDDQEYSLQEGQAINDVLLIEAGNRYALLEINGLRQRLSVNSQVRVKANYYEKSNKPVVIKAKAGGHHWVNGTINGKSVNFIVDTGASSISMNQSTASRLGINYRNAKKIRTNTANGTVEGNVVSLKRVAIGDIVQRNVTASVLPDNSLSVVLLGNSFLSKVDLRIDEGVMTLQAR